MHSWSPSAPWIDEGRPLYITVSGKVKPSYVSILKHSLVFEHLQGVGPKQLCVLILGWSRCFLVKHYWMVLPSDLVFCKNLHKWTTYSMFRSRSNTIKDTKTSLVSLHHVFGGTKWLGIMLKHLVKFAMLMWSELKLESNKSKL